MSKDPAFLFYPGDWLGGTMLFNRHHKGAYMDLLMAQFNNGHMTVEEINIVLGEKDEHLWESVLKPKFIQDYNGKYFNEKLEKEINKRKAFTESRKKNLKKEDIHISPHMEPHMENGNGNGNNNNNKGARKKKPFVKPTLEEVENYFEENGYKKEIGKKAWMGYDTANWFDSKGDPILNWKQKMINVWFKEENKNNKQVIPEFHSGSDK
jgi:hypothetical protein